nr:phycytochrome bilisome degradation protein [Porphyridium aerugineum]UNJ17909.1 phycytochrome bilisome degradation protein [Porphyridium aerugineum]
MLRKKINLLPEKESQEFLLNVIKQLMIKDNLLKYFMKSY